MDPGAWYPQTMSKYLSLKHLLTSKKKTIGLALAVEKIYFWGPVLGVPWGVAPKNFWKKITFAVEKLHTKIRFRGFVV